MPKFSKVFGINKSQAELDFVDIDLRKDSPLFLDPHSFAVRDDEWSIACNNDVVSFFATTLEAIKRPDAKKLTEVLRNLNEPNETRLGLSRGRPDGRGVSGKQLHDLQAALARSNAAKTGILKDLEECDLFIEGIGQDKISDITTNLIRGQLIRYTQQQCILHGIALRGSYPSGPIWDRKTLTWKQGFERLPAHNGQKILLVPKASVRLKMAISADAYYNHHVINFIKDEHLSANSSLVHALKNGKRRVYKTELKARHPQTKSFLAEFSEKHPEILAKYKAELGISRELRPNELEENFDEPAMCRVLAKQLGYVPKGPADASAYHRLMTGIMTFVFHPELIYPEIEREIHEGRKRIDIFYTNNSSAGFFFRMRRDREVKSRFVPVECKNYTREIGNPELDQILGRLGHSRGFFGMVVCREFEDRARVIARCRDSALDGRGLVIALADDDIFDLLSRIERGQRWTIDSVMDTRLREITG